MKTFILAALAASVVATPVLAAPYQGQYDNGRYEQQQQRGNDHDRGDRGDRGQYGRQDGRQNGRQDDRRFDQRRDGRGYQANYRQWQRGDRFDNRYASNYRVIDSPRYYRLHDAPRGYRWVQSGNDAVLIGLASGLVAAVLANSIH